MLMHPVAQVPVALMSVQDAMTVAPLAHGMFAVDSASVLGTKLSVKKIGSVAHDAG